jgi:hypothetical protein
MSADDPLPGISRGIALLSAWTLTAHEAARLDPYPEWQRLISSALQNGPDSSVRLVQGLMSLAQLLLWEESSGDLGAIRSRLQRLKNEYGPAEPDH